ncbi:MAG: PAS domain-containing protein [Balneolaceae bacterium]
MKFTPLRTALIYLFFALIWIFTTDRILESIVSDVTLLTKLQIIKGWFYVISTAFGLYLMMKSYESYIKNREEKQKVTEANLRVALKAANLGAWNYDVATEKLVVSGKHQDLLGLKKNEEPTTKKVFEKVVDEDLEKVKNAIRGVINKGNLYEVEYRINKDGVIRWIRSIGSPVKKHGKVVRVHGVIMDITEEKTQREELQMDKQYLQRIYDSLPVFLNVIDENMQIKDINKYITDRLGYEKKDVLSDNLINRMAPDSDDLKEAEHHIKNANGVWKDFNVQAKDGEVLKTSWTTIRISDKTSLGIGVDITDRYKLEQKIEESRKRLEVATDSANVGLWEWYPQTGRVIFDENWANLVGYELHEIEPVSIETWNGLVHPEDLKRFEQSVEAHFSGKTSMYECEVRMKHKNGHWVWILDRGKTVEWDEHGKPVRMSGTHVDISEQKENERLLKESQRVANLGTYVLSIDTHIAKTSRILDEIFGLPEGEKLTLPLWEKMIHPDYKYIVGDYDRAMEKGLPFEAEYKIVLQNDQEERWIYEKADVEYDENGEPVLMVGIMQDVTKVKVYEEELEREKNLFKITSDLVSDLVWDLDLQQNKVWWSDGIEQHFGFDREDIGDSLDFWSDHIHPDHLERVVTSLEKAIAGSGIIWEEEYIFLAANGDERQVLDRGYIFRDDNGKGVRMTGAILDLTEQKIAEELLQYQAGLLETMSDAVLSTDADFRLKSWNRAAEVIYGYKDYEVIGRKTSDVLKTEIVDGDIDEARSLVEKNGSWEGEVIQYSKSGNPVNIFASVQARYDENGEFIGSATVSRNITELKKVQDKLAREQKRFEYAASVVSDAIWDADPNAGTTWWSEGFKANFGYDIPPIEKGGTVWENAIHPDDRERVLTLINAAEEGEDTSWSEEYRFFRADGTIAYVLDQSFIMRDNEGNILRIIGAMNDITSEKMVKEELQRSEEHYRLLFEESPIPMWIYNPKTFQFESANNAAVKKYGYSEDEFQNMSIFDLHPESDQEVIRKEAEEDLKSHQTGFDEWTHITKSGEQIIAEISGTYIYEGDDQKRLLVANDITQQRTAEKKALSAMVEGEERERARVANELHDGLGQYLSAANMNLKTVYEDITDLSDKLRKPFKDGLSMLEHAITETRSISQNLLPKSIQDYGLQLAVASLVNDVERIEGIKLTLRQHYESDEIPQNIQVNLYRIVQESLNNAIRHANAKAIHLQLLESEKNLIYTIEDNGTGFKIDTEKKGGLGLQSMKTRVAAMAGYIDIDSKIDKGTMISVIIPINE